MKINDVFTLILKTMGLYLLINALFSGLPSNILFLFYKMDAATVFYILFSIAFPVAIFIALIFYSKNIVRFLKLTKGFEKDEIELKNLSAQKLLTLAIFIIGGLLIIENIPVFISQAIMNFKGVAAGIEFTSKDQFTWIVATLNIIVGFVLFAKHQYIVKLLKLNV